MTNDDDLIAQLAGRQRAYRQVRERIERDVLPRASSVDGVTFELQASAHQLRLRRGGYVVLEGDDGPRLGQVTDLDLAMETAAVAGLSDVGSEVRVQLVRGAGTVLDRAGTPFHAAAVRVAEPEEVGTWLSRTRPERAGLTIGELLLAPGVPATLDSGGLARHTFMCGQSGSGKTYSLGLLLERVIAETTLRIVVLDPNSDYVGLDSVRAGADPLLAERYAEVLGDVAVWRDDPAAEHPLRLRFADLDPASRAAALGLDPVADRDEYAALVDLLQRQQEGRPIITDLRQLLDDQDPGARALGRRAANLGLHRWSIWSPTAPSLIDEIRDPTSRCTVVDLGSLASAAEQQLVAEAVLTTLWETRLSRRPCLVVVDEAHNICAAEPESQVSRLSSERAVQIAAEGRKYGLYLLTSTQRPHKVHENVVSQCDNLLLMRMNSRADLGELASLFSFVPPGLISGATAFGMGHALVAGRLLPRPTYVRMGERVCEEGGADIPTTWAARGPHL